MNIRYFVFLVLVMIGVSSLASAQGRWEVDEAKLPPGKTKAQVQAMFEEIDRNTAQELEQERAAMQRQDERLSRALKKYEDRARKAVEKDPELRALQDKLEAGARALNNPQMSDEEREARFERMAPDMRAFHQKALAKAGIDERVMNADIVREMNSGVTTRGDGDDQPKNALLVEEDGVLYFATPNNEETQPVSEITTRGTDTEMLGDPWPWTQFGRSNAECSRCSTDKNNGTYQVSAQGVGISGQNYQGLAQFRRVMSGDKKFRVSARLPETYWNNYAHAGIFGGSQSRTWSKIEVWDDSSRVLCRAIEVHADLVATWGQFLQRYGEAALPLSCEFTAPPANHDIVISFISGAYINAAEVTGRTFGHVAAQPQDVTLWVTR